MQRIPSLSLGYVAYRKDTVYWTPYAATQGEVGVRDRGAESPYFLEQIIYIFLNFSLDIHLWGIVTRGTNKCTCQANLSNNKPSKEMRLSIVRWP